MFFTGIFNGVLKKTPRDALYAHAADVNLVFKIIFMIYAKALFLHNVKIMLPTVFDLSEEALQQGEAEYQRNNSSEEQENRDDEASYGHAFLRTADADD